MNKFSYDPLQYTDYCPQYSDSFFDYLKSLTNGVTVIECGAGSGQATQGLSRKFKRVVSIDSSFWDHF